MHASCTNRNVRSCTHSLQPPLKPPSLSSAPHTIPSSPPPSLSVSFFVFVPSPFSLSFSLSNMSAMCSFFLPLCTPYFCVHKRLHSRTYSIKETYPQWNCFRVIYEEYSHACSIIILTFYAQIKNVTQRSPTHNAMYIKYALMLSYIRLFICYDSLSLSLSLSLPSSYTNASSIFLNICNYNQS